MTNEVVVRLLESMDAGRLVMILGAGLSMAPPSRLPSAQRVAEMCFDKYQLSIDPHVDSSLRLSLEDLAEHFVQRNTLKSHFIASLVPWAEFERKPNPGHASVADFLLTGSVAAALSANYDKLIERCAWDYGADFQGSLDGDEATRVANLHSPLLKFHGCAHRDRDATVWALSQLEDPVISARLEKTRAWMAANLRNKDLLIVGFWSDWDYLNQIFEQVLENVDPSAITVVDPIDEAGLKGKAPRLWQLSHKPGVEFAHVRKSGAEFLDELRVAFSESYLRQMIAPGVSQFMAHRGGEFDRSMIDTTGLDSESLYAWRRDAEGLPVGSAARQRRPKKSELIGLFHLLMRNAGASVDGQGYRLRGRKVRVVNGAGELLGSVISRFAEPPAASGADVVVAVGAVDYGLPANPIRTGEPGSIIRPAPREEWLTFDQAVSQLGV